MADENRSAGLALTLFFGFIAGYLATLIFHQLALALMWSMDFAPYKPFSTTPTRPFGIPAVVSLAFWGGLWGMLLALILVRISSGKRYWLTAVLFGAVCPSLVALFVVLPMKGQPMGGGWHMRIFIMAFIINGAWGLGVGLFYKLFTALTARSTARA